MDDRRNVVAAVIERMGRFLVCRRDSSKRHGRLWEFPGGKFEPGETLEEAATRELAEELSLRVTEVGEVLLAVADPETGYTIHFTVIEAEGEPVLLEHSAADWCAAVDLLRLPLAPCDRAFAEYLTAVGRERL